MKELDLVGRKMFEMTSTEFVKLHKPEFAAELMQFTDMTYAFCSIERLCNETANGEHVNSKGREFFGSIKGDCCIVLVDKLGFLNTEEIDCVIAHEAGHLVSALGMEIEGRTEAKRLLMELSADAYAVDFHGTEVMQSVLLKVSADVAPKIARLTNRNADAVLAELRTGREFTTRMTALGYY